MRLIILLLSLTFSCQLMAQEKFVTHDFIKGNIPSYKPAFNDSYPEWAKMLYQEKANFFEIQKNYMHWKLNSKNEFKAIERYYKIWVRKIKPYVNNDGNIITSHSTYKTSQIEPNLSSENEWQFLGPKETFFLNETGGEIATSSCPWQVNVYCFDVSKSNDSILYCGTETGFVNKSVDKGDTWSMLAIDYSFNGGITAITIDPQNPQIVYVAAGSQIHKTTDGGQNWSALLSTDALFYSDKIIIDESNSDNLISAGSSGIYRSSDGGVNWTNPWPSQSYDVHYHSTNPLLVFAISVESGDFRILKSTDGGANFNEISSFPDDIEDVSGALLAISADETESVFALLLSADDTPLLYKGNWVVDTWQILATGQTDDFPLENWQGFYDLVFEVSPDDADVMFAGTSSLYKSTDGGETFSIIGGYGGDFSIHPDAQCMLLLENNTAWLTTDGGFSYSTDNFTNTNNASYKNKNLVGSDMWGFDQGWNEDIVVGGRYHNGNTAIADFYQPKALRMGGAESPTGWVMKGKSRHVAFNDLGQGWILPTSAESSPQGRFSFNKYPNMDEYGGRRGNMVFHTNYYEVIFLGEGNAFWKSNDMGQTFELLHDFGQRVRYIQIAYNNPDVIYADIVNQGLHKSEDGGYTWTAKPNLTNGENGQSFWKGKLHFDVSPNHSNTIYACLQNGIWSSDLGKVFKSIDGGDTWTDWTANLNPYAKSLVVQPDDLGNDILYLFTSNINGENAQCYIRRHEESEWSIYGSDFPVGTDPNHALAFYRDSKIRIAGTSGVWENDLDEMEFLPIIQPWVNRPIIDCIDDTIQLEDHSILNHENCSWSWIINPAPNYIEDENIRNPKVVLGAIGNYSVTLNVTKNGTTFSKTIEDMIYAKECPSIENCENPALVPKEDWTLRYVNSEEVNYPGYATMAFDNDPSTIWHTQWSTGDDPYPHQIEIDFNSEFKISEFTYHARQNGENGRIKDMEIYFSSDPLDYGTADTVVVFENTAAPQKILFQNPKIGRYMRIIALSEVNGGPWSSAAEFDIKACYNTSQIENKDFKNLKAYPIPTRGNLRVSLPSLDSYYYTLYTIDGKKLYAGEAKINEGYFEIDLSTYKDGTYVIEIFSNDGRKYQIKSIKK